MTEIHYNKTDETPLVHFKANGELLIEGVSIPENVAKFYKPVMDWLHQFASKLPPAVVLTLHLEYMNTSSTRVFIDIIKTTQKFSSLADTSIVWLHNKEDEDAIELGKELEYSAGVQFEFRAI